MQDFATRLKELRVGRGLRQKDLAGVLGLAQTTIANYEQKLRFPDEPTLVRIADFFSVSLDHLMGRDGADTLKVAAGAGSRSADDGGLSGLARDYFELLQNEGAAAACARLDQAFSGGMDLKELYLGVFAPALREVGTRWARGLMSVGDEHAFSEATQRLMAHFAPRPGSLTNGRARCLVLVASGEAHVIGARMVSDLLSLAGFDTRFAGGNLSIGHALEMLRASPPALLAVSVTTPEHLNAAQDLIRALRADKALARIRVLAGGQALDGDARLAARIGADASGIDADQAVKAAVTLVGDARGGL
jgi:MerR family transcriptional regulator, light-induced transcriptional regulator